MEPVSGTTWTRFRFWFAASLLTITAGAHSAVAVVQVLLKHMRSDKVLHELADLAWTDYTPQSVVDLLVFAALPAKVINIIILSVFLEIADMNDGP